MPHIVNLGLSDYKALLLIVSGNKGFSFSCSFLSRNIIWHRFITLVEKQVMLQFFQPRIEAESKGLRLDNTCCVINGLFCRFNPCLQKPGYPLKVVETYLNEVAPEKLPIILRMKYKRRLYPLIGNVNSWYLSDLFLSVYPQDILILVFNILQLLSALTIINYNYLLQAMLLPKSIDREKRL